MTDLYSDPQAAADQAVERGEAIKSQLAERAAARTQARERADREADDREERIAAARKADRDAREDAAEGEEAAADLIYDGGRKAREAEAEREEVKRKAIGQATSSGAALRPTGMRARSTGWSRISGVSTEAGATPLTSTLCGPAWRASHLTRACTPPLEAT